MGEREKALAAGCHVVGPFDRLRMKFFATAGW